MPVNKGGIGNVQYPLIADLDKSIARNYDVLLGTTPATVITDDDEIAETMRHFYRTEVKNLGIDKTTGINNYKGCIRWIRTYIISPLLQQTHHMFSIHKILFTPQMDKSNNWFSF